MLERTGLLSGPVCPRLPDLRVRQPTHPPHHATAAYRVIAVRPCAPPCALKGGRFRIAIRPSQPAAFRASI